MNQPILLTGGSGMVGKNLLDVASVRDLSVAAPASQELDLRDYQATVAYLRQLRPTVIIHAAGKVGGIQANIDAPVSFLTDNWDMGRNIVLAARETAVPYLLNLGSSCMYPRNSPNALKEEEVLAGPLESTNEGYALAKCAVLRLCQYVERETPRCQYKTIIPCNIYGPYDKFDPRRSHLVPAVIHKLHHAKVAGHEEVEIWGDGTARREFMFAGDLVDAILAAVERFDGFPSVMNVGVGDDLSVEDYYRAMAEVVGFTGRFRFDRTKPVGMMRKLLDVSKARAWGWEARTSLSTGLRATYDHYLTTGFADAVPAG